MAQFSVLALQFLNPALLFTAQTCALAGVALGTLAPAAKAVRRTAKFRRNRRNGLLIAVYLALGHSANFPPAVGQSAVAVDKATRTVALADHMPAKTSGFHRYSGRGRVVSHSKAALSRPAGWTVQSRGPRPN